MSLIDDLLRWGHGTVYDIQAVVIPEAALIFYPPPFKVRKGWVDDDLYVKVQKAWELQLEDLWDQCEDRYFYIPISHEQDMPHLPRLDVDEVNHQLYLVTDQTPPSYLDIVPGTMEVYVFDPEYMVQHNQKFSPAIRELWREGVDGGNIYVTVKENYVVPDNQLALEVGE